MALTVARHLLRTLLSTCLFLMLLSPVPPRALNGLRCPGCFTQDTHVCDPVQTVNCANEEKKCIDFVGIISQ
ncbi:hypothetical protein lerEdw1_012694, partial [Lerista edwardsae]